MNRVKYIAIVALVMVFAAAGCKNPAAGKPAAEISDNGISSPVVSARGESITFSEKNGQLRFVGSKVTGSERCVFDSFSGKIDLVDRNPLKSQVSIDIETKSVSCESKGLAEHLRTPDFFDVEKYPKATFVSDGVEKDGDKYKLSGGFDFHGVKKSISFPTSIQVSERSITVKSEFSLNRRDFGVNYAGRANDLIRDEVLLKFDLKLNKD